MTKSIKCFQLPLRLIGFTGSTLTQKEVTCIELCYQTTPVIFPSINTLKADKKVHHKDELIPTTQGKYIERLLELIREQSLKTPIVIVANQTYSIIENSLQKLSDQSFYSMKTYTGSKTEAYLDGKFAQKNAQGKYGVYLLNEL